MFVSSLANTPVWKGWRPLNTAAREGLQSGAAQCAFVKSTPRLARRSIFGVRACGCPPRQPTQSFRSSIAMNSTLGGAAADMAGHSAQEKTGNSNQHTRRELCFMICLAEENNALARTAR